MHDDEAIAKKPVARLANQGRRRQCQQQPRRQLPRQMPDIHSRGYITYSSRELGSAKIFSRYSLLHVMKMTALTFSSTGAVIELSSRAQHIARVRQREDVRMTEMQRQCCSLRYSW